MKLSRGERPLPALPDSAQSASVGRSPLSHAGERAELRAIPRDRLKVSVHPEVDDM